MIIENSASIYFGSTFVDSINIFDCRLSGVSSLIFLPCEIIKPILNHVNTNRP